MYGYRESRGRWFTGPDGPRLGTDGVPRHPFGPSKHLAQRPRADVRLWCYLIVMRPSTSGLTVPLFFSISMKMALSVKPR